MPITVPPQWPSKRPCKIAFVAEAPGDEEMSKLKPLIGPSGKLFDKLLRMADIRRSECLVTNVFNTQLPDNDVKNWCVSKKATKEWEGFYDLPPVARGANLHWDHVHHLVRLAEELKEAAPNVIIPLGGTALWALTGFSSIMARRGAVDEATMTAPGTKILPTFHPAFLFHSYKLLHVTVMDLIKAREESHTPYVYTTPCEVWIEPTIEDMMTFMVRHLMAPECISIDIETIPGFRAMKSIAFAPTPNVSIVVPFTDMNRLDNSYWRTAEDEATAWEWVKGVCESEAPKVGQNFCVPGRVEVLTLDGWIRLDRLRDRTMVAQWFLETEEIKFLPAVSVRQVGGFNVRRAKSRDHRCVYTQNHRVVWRPKTGGAWAVDRADVVAEKPRVQIPTAGFRAVGGETLEYLELIVAIQADAYLTPTRAVFNLKKTRKIERLSLLCAKYGAELVEGQRSHQDERAFSISGDIARYAWIVLGKEKLWPAWILDMSPSQRDEFLGELQHWDGARCGRGIAYLCSKPHNLRMVAGVAVLSGWSSRQLDESRIQITPQAYTNLLKEHWTEAPYNGDLYCLHTQAGFFVARSEGRTFITGNSYDFHWLYDKGIAVKNYSSDTMLMHHALYLELKKDLAFLGACYAKRRAWKLLRGSKSYKRDD